MKQVEMQRTRWQRRAEWSSLRQWYRSEVSRVLRDIEKGFVNEVDFAKLSNFCMVSLMVQTKIEEPTWRAGERAAEIAALLRDEVEEYQIEA